MNLTFDNVDAICSTIDLSINPSEIDFQRVTFFEPGGIEGGMGLTVVREEMLALGGAVRLATGDGYVTMTASGELYGFQAFDLPGVQAEIEIPEGA